MAMMDFVQEHPTLAIGGGLLAALAIGGILINKKSTPATAASDLSGLTNGLVYVPTQTTFSTVNTSQSGVFASNDPTLTTVTTGSVNSPTSTKTTQGGGRAPGGGNAPPPIPIHSPPTQGGKPPATGKSLKWDQRHTIAGGETLSSIAAQVTRQLRAQGMPGSMALTWHDLYAHNTSVITSTAAAHHNPIPGGPWNDLFPGEQISTPRWG